MSFVLSLIIMVLLPMILPGSAQMQETPRASVPLPTPSVYASRWFPPGEIDAPKAYEGSRDRRFIFIWQDQQMMYVLEDGQVIREIPCSTGLPTSYTYTKSWSGRVGKYWGSFNAYGVWADEAWYLFKDDGSILIHGAPYVFENETKVYQELDLLGKAPASHGCIRIPPEDARWLTAWQPKGVLTVITPLTAWPIRD
jgi:hypothetical protein